MELAIHIVKYIYVFRFAPGRKYKTNPPTREGKTNPSTREGKKHQTCGFSEIVTAVPTENGDSKIQIKFKIQIKSRGQMCECTCTYPSDYIITDEVKFNVRVYVYIQ